MAAFAFNPTDHPQPAQVGVLLAAARKDPLGIYFAFGFLTGARPSEQLAVLWEDIYLERNVVFIRRMQERNGQLFEMTKTAREIPLAPLMREMLVRRRSICPHRTGEPHRVFPGPKGVALTYWNWLGRFYRPALLRSSRRCRRTELRWGWSRS